MHAGRWCVSAQPEPELQLLTAQDLGPRLGVTPRWILAEARAGRIPHYRLGRQVRFAWPDLELWLAGCAVTPDAGPEGGDPVDNRRISQPSSPSPSRSGRRRGAGSPLVPLPTLPPGHLYPPERGRRGG
jgi:excisionase family DNA binding protein